MHNENKKSFKDNKLILNIKTQQLKEIFIALMNLSYFFSHTIGVNTYKEMH